MHPHYQTLGFNFFLVLHKSNFADDNCLKTRFIALNIFLKSFEVFEVRFSTKNRGQSVKAKTTNKRVEK